ncbi:5-azacytidine-induced protein 2 isoform X1 [Bombina bombina]|uniref:5-azacytidine-induced protein 2 isoform X1 n=1 Tax=Bombina bombina TaxID=8345 RepID=UPI00235A666D|nr:5-azacytidine-induced protein 2 isoform X1 [Bombina bombina]
MDATVDDDICILNHEKADFARRQDQEIPFSASSGEESVASHFALITAYEDIKKRLKETERDNYSLKKRLRILEEKLCETNPEELNMVKCKPVNEVWSSREQLNKAFIAYREVCIERDRLKSKVDILEKEKAESKKTLYQQLESKEMELLQVESELETQKVMRCLDKTPTDWEIEKQNSDLKLRTMEQELELLQNEYQLLKAELQSTKDQAVEKPLFSNENYTDDNSVSDSDMRQAFRELKKEMSNLHLVTEVQAEVLRKLKATVTVTKKGK